MSGSLTGLVTHTRRVQSLYKKVLRTLEHTYNHREIFRFHATVMRESFEKNRGILDIRVATELVEKAEDEVFLKSHHQPYQFPNSPGGVAWGREVIPPDWVVDYWHPLEKAQYPEYFARREQRKKQFVKLWEKKYGKSTFVSSH